MDADSKPNTPGSDSNPSRTSVNLLGDAAVSNRGLASASAYAAIESRCRDANGNGTIETSTGPNDIRAWDQEECRLWHHVFLDASPDTPRGPRPTQWEGGKFGDAADGQPDPNPRLWVGYVDSDGQVQLVRLDGMTGDELDRASLSVATPDYGAYGGVVNQNGDLWAISMDPPLLHLVDADSLQVTTYAPPEGSAGPTQFYGLAIDADGNPWITIYTGKVAVYDVAQASWTMIDIPNGPGQVLPRRMRGIQIDREGRAWAAANRPCGLVELDVATRTLSDAAIELPGCSNPVGVSIDVNGFVWSPDEGADRAFMLDPESHDVTIEVTGLVDPYTYSDMTGAGLALVVDPPVE